MKTQFLLLFSLLFASTSTHAATHSGAFLPVKETTPYMLSPIMEYPGFAVADTAALDKKVKLIKARTRTAWFSVFWIGLGAIGLALSGLNIGLLVVIMAIMGIIMLINLFGAAIAIDQLKAMLIDAPPSVAAEYLQKISVFKIALQALMFSLTMGLTAFLLV